MDAQETITAYYEALRSGEPLGPFFASPQTGSDPVKFGISERLVGLESITDGLREQTHTSSNWTVESRDLRVTEKERVAWFSDDVFLSWTDTTRGIRFEFETRWSGVLEQREQWHFVNMHVSTATEF